MMNHPLAALESDDDEDEFLVRRQQHLRIDTDERSKASSDNDVASTAASSPVAMLDSQTLAQANAIRSKGAAKRLAPKPPSAAIRPVKEADLINNEFLIPVEHVRWFYKAEKDKHNSNTNQVSASSSDTKANTESDMNNNTNGDAAPPIGSKIKTVKNWVIFNKWDSINLETEYRKMTIARRLSRDNVDNEEVLVQVLDNLYEVNLQTRKCYPIYLKTGKKMKVQRCLWYRGETNDPFDEKIGNDIERKHLELFRDVLHNRLSVGSDTVLDEAATDTASVDSATSLTSKAVSKSTNKSSSESSKSTSIEPIGSLQFEDGTVTWFSESEVYMEKNKTNVLDFLKMQDLLKYNKNKISSGTKIKRGYVEKQKEADAGEKPQEITHLVFVVHGIAQKLYENGIVKSCDDLSKEIEKQKNEFLSSYSDHRYVFIPVDWRTSLTLDDGVIESITPKSIQSIRDKLNSSLLDIMYYTSPMFKIEILNSLTSEANRLYNLFCQKNPSFKEKHNKVSIIAHSLGTVIIYDILTSNDWMKLSNGNESIQDKLIFEHYASNDKSSLLNEYTSCKRRMQEIEKTLINGTNKATSFDFKTENFFLLGSPLGVFLALRGLMPDGNGSQDHILPKHLCTRLFNIFHPSDPVAYRLEPLILKHYTSKSPVELIRVSDVAKKGLPRDTYEKRSALDVDLKSSLTSKTSSTYHKKKEKDSRSAELSQIREDNSMVTLSSRTTATTTNAIDQVELDEAIDYQLQESSFEIVATFKAHSCYWKSSDVALFIIQQLCQNDEKDKSISVTSRISKI